MKNKLISLKKNNQGLQIQEWLLTCDENGTNPELIRKYAR